MTSEPRGRNPSGVAHGSRGLDEVFERLAPRPGVLVDEFTHEREIWMPEMCFKILGSSPLLEDADPTRHDRVGREHVALAAGLIGTGRLLEGHAGGYQLVPTRRFDINPTCDHDHGGKW